MSDPAETALPPTGLARRAGFAMAWGQLGKLVELLLTTAIAILAVRALQPQAFGMYSLLTNLAGVAAVLIPLVGTEALGAVLPRFSDRRERLAVLVAVVAARLTVIGGVGLLVLPFWDELRDEIGLATMPTKLLVATVGYWAAQDLLNNVAGYYVADIAMRSVALWRAAGQLLTLAVLLTLALTGNVSVGNVIGAVALGYAIGIAGLVAGLRSTGLPRRPPPGRLRFVFSFTPNVWLLGVAALALQPHVYVVLIGAITQSPPEVAYYAAAAGVLGRAQTVLILGWAALIVPTFGTLYLRDGLNGLARASRLFSQLWLLVAAPLSALLLVLAEPLIVVLFGPSYEPAATLLAWVAGFGLATAFLLSPTSHGRLWALDRQGTLLRVRLVTTPLGLGLAVLLIHEHGALGAVLATGLTTFVTAAAELVLAQRAAPAAYPLRFAGWSAVAALAAVAPALVIRPDGPLGLAASAALGIAALVVSAAVVRPFGREDLDALRAASPRLAASPLRRLARG